MMKTIIADILVAIGCLSFLSSLNLHPALGADIDDHAISEHELQFLFNGEQERQFLLSVSRTNDVIRDLRSNRRDSAALALRKERIKLRDGSGSTDRALQAAEDFIVAELELIESREGRVRAIREYSVLVRQIEKQAIKKSRTADSP